MTTNQQTSPEIHPVAGVRLAAVAGGLRYPNRLDLALIELSRCSVVGGVFTSNVFRAAPVIVAKRNLAAASTRYLLVNTGNANAGTGKPGLDDADRCCSALARLGGVDAAQVLPFSTGVIGERLPVERLIAALPELYDSLNSTAWRLAATAIMTTDTRPKLASRRIELAGQCITISGMAKGSGMIKPDLATMLAFVCTDIGITRPDLQTVLNAAVARSFNRITVDGDTSTNDCCMLAATGRQAVHYDRLSQNERQQFVNALFAVCEELAKGLIRDAEGASKFVTVSVCDGISSEECLQVAYAIAESPLVKTALFASDPNWGRILAAVGRSGIKELNIANVALYLGDILIALNGSLVPEYREELGQLAMNRDEITITIRLGRGQCSETVWTSDLSHDYVRINAEYRT